jgi:hypothetical protein
VKFLRRQPSEDAEHGPADEAEGTSEQAAQRGHTPGKGRPTPKRRDAESKRRGPAPPPPKTQREAIRLAKQTQASRKVRREEAAKRRARMMAGDDRALPARDRGPVRAYVRDLVDSKRHLLGAFMPLAGLVFLSLVIPVPRVQQLFSLFCMAMMASMAVEGVLLGRITKQARLKFPKETISGGGIGWYAFTRATQIRKLRVPKPKVQVGDKI